MDMGTTAEPGNKTPRFRRLRSVSYTGGFLDGVGLNIADRLTHPVGLLAYEADFWPSALGKGEPWPNSTSALDIA